MPKTKISEFSATPANNTDIDSINIAEGCAPSGINDAIRELMAQLKDFQTGAVGDSFNGPVGTTTAAAGAFTTLAASSTLAVTGVATLTAQPILSSLTASRAVFTDASKGLVSNAITGTGNVVMSTSPTLVTPILGTPTSGTLTNATGLPLSTGVTGTLPVANGGTGTATPSIVAGTNVTVTGTWPNQTIAASGGGGGSSATPTTEGTVYAKTDNASLAFLGNLAGNSNTGANSVAVGYAALTTNSTGANNTAVGSQAAYTNSTGTYVAAFGYKALYYNTTGSYNAAFGGEAMGSNTTGANNVAVGIAALNANTTGNYNVAIGREALVSNTTGSALTAIGWRAGYSQNTSGDCYSTYVGYSAGSQITTGVANVCLGWQTGQVLTTGVRNIYIGFNNSASATGASDEILISTQAGTAGKGSSTGFISAGGGGVYQGNNGATWSVTSDRRLKKNIVDNNTGLDKITAIQVRNFEYRLPEEITELATTNAIKKSGVQLGVIAQELQAVLPECVKTEDTGVMSVDSDNLTWYMINAIKELKAELDAYKASHP